MPLPLYGQSLFGQRARARVVPRDGQWDRQLDQCLVVAASTHAGQIAVCWRRASDGWSLFRLTMFGGLP
jgi:hypothetical protein